MLTCVADTYAGNVRISSLVYRAFDGGNLALLSHFQFRKTIAIAEHFCYRLSVLYLCNLTRLTIAAVTEAAIDAVGINVRLAFWNYI